MRLYFTGIMAMLLLTLADVIFVQNCMASWDTQPTLEMSENYTNNVDLSPSGQEQSEFITRISPQLNITSEGRNTRLNLAYRYERLFYKNDASQNTGYNQANLTLYRKLYKDWLFLDALGNYTQQVINEGQSENINNSFVSGNRTDVASYNVSPYAKFKFGDAIESELRASYGEVKYRRNPEFNSKVTGGSVVLQRPPQVGPFGWNLKLQSNSIKSNSSQSDLESGSAESVYRVTQHYQLFIGALYENNKFEQQLIGPSTNGTFLYGGFRWRPSDRARVEMSCGERFFGNSCSAVVENKTQSTTLSASYKKDVESAAQRQIAALTQNAVTGEISSVQFLTNDIYITRRWDLTAAYRLYRNDIGVGYFNEAIEYQTDFRTEGLAGATASWIRRISRRSSLSTSATWEKREYSISGEVSKTTTAQIRLDHNLRRNMSGSAFYEYRKKDSNLESATYQANLVGVSVAIRF